MVVVEWTVAVADNVADAVADNVADAVAGAATATAVDDVVIETLTVQYTALLLLVVLDPDRIIRTVERGQ